MSLIIKCDIKFVEREFYMQKIVCGELRFKRKKFYFNFQDNILTIQPVKMEDYVEWFFEEFINEEEHKKYNLEGTTNEGNYICFIEVIPRPIGRGAFSSFVPAYIIGKTNGLNPLPNCKEIHSIIFSGECVDRLYHPKQILSIQNDNKEINIKTSLKENYNKEFMINKDKHFYFIHSSILQNKDINNVLKVDSKLEIIFDKEKTINQIMKYYHKITHFFSFINNRKIITFNEIILRKKIKVDFGNEIKDMKTDFTLYVNHNPEQKIDLHNNKHSYISLTDIEKNYDKIFNEVSDNNFLIHYYPLNKNENFVIDNNKYIQISSAFESEFNKTFKNFKASKNENYRIVKDNMLKYIQTSINELSNNDNKDIKKQIKYLNNFKTIINNVEGSLEEKIAYALEKYDNILKPYKEDLLKTYHIENIKKTILSRKFSERRNKISHGLETDFFSDVEIIGYILIKYTIYCITFDRLGFSEKEIKEFLNKIF